MENDIKIMIAVISASSAIAGAVVSQILSIVRDLFDKRHKKYIFIREKYEELAELVSASEEWALNQITAKSKTELKTQPPTFARNVMVLSHLYFPVLQDACHQYVNACRDLQLLLLRNHEIVDGMSMGDQAVDKNKSNFVKIASQYHEAQRNLDEQISMLINSQKPKHLMTRREVSFIQSIVL